MFKLMVDYDSHLQRLIELITPCQCPLVLTHNNPDPDAMASGFAMRYLLSTRLDRPIKMAAGGIVGRAENRAMMAVLQLPLCAVSNIDWDQHDGFVLLDTQEGAGNNSLPKECSATAVIDHHPASVPQRAPLVLVDESVGATSTVMTQMLEAAGLIPPPDVATALLFGIKTDTNYLARHVTQLDIDAYLWLHALADLEKLALILNAREPAVYFTLLHRVLESSRLYEGRVVVSDLGDIPIPDIVSEMADLLVRRENVEWGFIIGQYQDQLVLSLRTTHTDQDAGTLIQTGVGSYGQAGGHEQLAGGMIACKHMSDQEVAAIKEQVISNVLAALQIDPANSRPFI